MGRLYRLLGDYPTAAQSTSKGVAEAIEQGNIFTAAFHLQEMVEDNVLEELFIIAMEKARKEESLWWQYRCLEELGWDSEAQQFLLEHKEDIEALGEPHFIEPLSLALGDTARYVELRKEEASALSAKPLPEED